MADNDDNINDNDNSDDEFPEDLDFEQHLEEESGIANAEDHHLLSKATYDNDDDDDDDDDDMFDFYAHGCYYSVRVADIMNPVARVHPFLGHSGVFVGCIVSTAHSLLSPTSTPAHTIHWRSYELHSSMLAKHRQQPMLAKHRQQPMLAITNTQ